MSRPGTALDLVQRIKRKAPEYLDLLTAETDAEFEAAFDWILENAIARLEKNKKNLRDLDENGLSTVLAAALTIPGLTAIQEANSNGHVDITIEADHCFPARTKLGEAKIYDGFKYHIKGLDQLLNRYTTGREKRGFLVFYVRKRDIAGLVSKLRNTMDEKLPLDQQGKTSDHVLKWSFLSVHVHSCGENLQVGHVGCNLFIE